MITLISFLPFLGGTLLTLSIIGFIAEYFIW